MQTRGPVKPIAHRTSRVRRVQQARHVLRRTLNLTATVFPYVEVALRVIVAGAVILTVASQYVQHIDVRMLP